MDPVERESLLDQLDESRDTVLIAIEDLTETQGSYRPEDGWSIVQIVEHLASAEQMMFGLISERFTELPEPAINREREERIRRLAPQRLKKVQAPPGAHPHGDLSLTDAIGRFLDTRGRTRQFIRDFDGDLRARSVVHPVVGPLNAHECLLLMIAHCPRHTVQMREVMEAPGFPAASLSNP